MGIELELGLLLLLTTLGTSFFAVFEVETPGWRKLTKWWVVYGLTLGLYLVAGHWSLLFPAAAGSMGVAFHTVWCRRHSIHPLHATPRRQYYDLRGWKWPE